MDQMRAPSLSAGPTPWRVQHPQCQVQSMAPQAMWIGFAPGDSLYAPWGLDLGLHTAERGGPGRGLHAASCWTCLNAGCGGDPDRRQDACTRWSQHTGLFWQGHLMQPIFWTDPSGTMKHVWGWSGDPQDASYSSMGQIQPTGCISDNPVP